MLLACIVGWTWMALSERYVDITSSIPFDLKSTFGWSGVAVLAFRA